MAEVVENITLHHITRSTVGGCRDLAGWLAFQIKRKIDYMKYTQKWKRGIAKGGCGMGTQNIHEMNWHLRLIKWDLVVSCYC